MAVAVAAGQHLSVTYDVLLPNKQYWRERGFALEQRKSRITVDTSSCVYDSQHFACNSRSQCPRSSRIIRGYATLDN